MNISKDNSRIHPRVIGATVVCATALMLGAAPLASAQIVPFPMLTSYLYTAPFVCGTAEPTRDLQSTGDAFASPYDDLEPGSYSATRSDGDSGVGGVSIDTRDEAPRELDRFVLLPVPISP